MSAVVNRCTVRVSTVFAQQTLPLLLSVFTSEYTSIYCFPVQVQYRYKYAVQPTSVQYSCRQWVQYIEVYTDRLQYKYKAAPHKSRDNLQIAVDRHTTVSGSTRTSLQTEQLLSQTRTNMKYRNRIAIPVPVLVRVYTSTVLVQVMVYLYSTCTY